MVPELAITSERFSGGLPAVSHLNSRIDPAGGCLLKTAMVGRIISAPSKGWNSPKSIIESTLAFSARYLRNGAAEIPTHPTARRDEAQPPAVSQQFDAQFVEVGEDVRRAGVALEPPLPIRLVRGKPLLPNIRRIGHDHVETAPSALTPCPSPEYGRGEHEPSPRPSPSGRGENTSGNAARQSNALGWTWQSSTTLLPTRMVWSKAVSILPRAGRLDPQAQPADFDRPLR